MQVEWRDYPPLERVLKLSYIGNELYFKFGAEILVVGSWNNNSSIFFSGVLINAKKLYFTRWPSEYFRIIYILLNLVVLKHIFDFWCYTAVVKC